MKKIFSIDVSYQEIIVLAAACGYDTVFGIENDERFYLDEKLKENIAKTMNAVNTKKMVRYELDGTLYIKKELKECIECVCTADTIGLFNGDVANKKSTTVYVLKKENRTVILQKNKWLRVSA